MDVTWNEVLYVYVLHVLLLTLPSAFLLIPVFAFIPIFFVVFGVLNISFKVGHLGWGGVFGRAPWEPFSIWLGISGCLKNYMDRIGKSIEKKLEFYHHEKVGVVNALVGASTMLTNAPRLLNLEHNHYINNSGCKDLYDTTKHKRSPKSNRKATCYQLSSDDSTLAKVCRIWTKNGKVICCQLSSYGKSLITVKHGLDLSLSVCLRRQLL